MGGFHQILHLWIQTTPQKGRQKVEESNGMDDSRRTGSFELTLKKKSYELTESEAASSAVGMYVSAQKLQHKMDV